MQKSTNYALKVLNQFSTFFQGYSLAFLCKNDLGKVLNQFSTFFQGYSLAILCKNDLKVVNQFSTFLGHSLQKSKDSLGKKLKIDSPLFPKSIVLLFCANYALKVESIFNFFPMVIVLPKKQDYALKELKIDSALFSKSIVSLFCAK